MKDPDAAVYIIVAMTKDRIIGKGQALPWSIPEEMETFKRLTVGNTVIMGRNTFMTIGHPLQGRNNIIISKTLTSLAGVQIAGGLAEALVMGKLLKKKIFIIGGANIYKAALPIADYMYVSWIHGDFDGEIRFPEFNKALWQLQEEQEFEKFTLSLYSRRLEGAAEAITNVN